jgi:hypothetical protein
MQSLPMMTAAARATRRPIDRTPKRRKMAKTVSRNQWASPYHPPRLSSADVCRIQVGDRAASPEQVVHVSVPESLGPSEEEDGDFARELARMITDGTADTRKVDKRTAAALWDAAVLPPAARRRREDGEDAQDMMKFTLITKRGNKQQVRCFDRMTTWCKADEYRLGHLMYRRKHRWQCRRVRLSFRTKKSSSTSSDLCLTTNSEKKLRNAKVCRLHILLSLLVLIRRQRWRTRVGSVA